MDKLYYLLVILMLRVGLFFQWLCGFFIWNDYLSDLFSKLSSRFTCYSLRINDQHNVGYWIKNDDAHEFAGLPEKHQGK